MGDRLQRDVPLADGWRDKPIIKVRQRPTPPRSWRWEIWVESEQCHRWASESIYRSAHDAWNAGTDQLARTLRRQRLRRDQPLNAGLSKQTTPSPERTSF